MKWHDHPRSSTAILASGYVLQINKTATDQWRARAIGMPVDGEFPTRESAKSAAIAEATRRAKAVLLAVGWPDDGANDAADAVLFKGGTVHAALIAALKEACND